MTPDTPAPRPLERIQVLEFTHMVMGPTVGAILADLGADVIKVEPIGGDPTRDLRGSGAGYFAMYNRGKKSICLNLKDPQGLALARRLAARADVLVENFRAGALDALGLSYAALAQENPRLIYCTQKGFLAGPYQHRAALDEVAQMMGGLAYMTGPPGRPLRAGASVVDVTGGMFGVIGILAALHLREQTGRGQKIGSALFETTAYLVGQHMAQQTVTGEAPRPMPVRLSAWAVYDVFDTRDERQLFIGVVSDGLWMKFCRSFDLQALAADPAFKTNAHRVAARDTLLPIIRELCKRFSRDELTAKLEHTGIPFAPINKPEDLFDDPHLLAGQGLGEVTLPDGRVTRLPTLPLEMDGARATGSGVLPNVGRDSVEILQSLDLSAVQIAELMNAGVVG